MKTRIYAAPAVERLISPRANPHGRPVYTTPQASVGHFKLGQGLRRWPNLKPTLANRTGLN